MFEGNTRDNQEILDYLTEVFVDGMAPACSTNGMCTYGPAREDQVGCAVGCLLPSGAQAYFDTIGPAGINSIHEEIHSHYAKFFDETQLDFLRDIQDFHDNECVGVFQDDLKKRETSQPLREAALKRVAAKHHLNYKGETV